MKSNLTLWVALIAVAIIAVGGYFFPQIQTVLGSVGTRFPNGLAVGTTASVTQNKMTIGNTGTAIGNYQFGSCTLIGTDVSQAASTTVPYDCAVTGATSASIVFGLISTSTSRATGGVQSWIISGAKASTTAGYVTFMLTNNGSAVAPSVTSVGSSTSYILIN